jgi:hypothetical protein
LTNVSFSESFDDRGKSDMKDPTGDAGTIQAVLERLNTQRLPRALRMREKVDRGETLDEYDLRFLHQVFADAGQARTLVSKHPELQSLANRLIDLYNHITKKALENEQSASGTGS